MLTRFALANPMLVLALVLIAMIAGPLSFLTHPSREDPKITIRQASVQAQFPGMPALKVEQLLTTALEEKIREIPEVDEIKSTSSTGQALISITVGDDFTDLNPIWTTLRDKMEEVKSSLPSGTKGPFVDTDRGDVAMATIALTADGFDNAEMHVTAKELRRKLYARVPGVRKVTFFGVLEQQVHIEFDVVRLSQLGMEGREIVDAIQNQNVIQPGGQVEAGGTTLTVQPTGDFETLAEVRSLAIAVPNSAGQSLQLGDISDISLTYKDPPGPHAYFNGAPAIVIGVSMTDGFDASAFATGLSTFIGEAKTALPLGMFLEFITFQPDEIKSAIAGVLNNLWQTIVIVLLVVVAFLGLRTGLLVGAMVPLVMVCSILVMRVAGIDLERMSLASLIISLGLLVDNGIVVAEEIQARLARGEERVKAAKAVGAQMSGPLLASSLTTIFAFMPLMLMPGSAGEYTRSISLVVAISLLVSWAVALTALTLLCMWLLKPGEAVDEEKAYDRGYLNAYRRAMGFLVRWRWITAAASFATIILGVMLFANVSKTFFPASERAQLQVTVRLPVGSNTYATGEVVNRLQAWLLDKKQNPEVKSLVSYVATGGPRFYLSLSPIDGFPNNGYFIVNLDRFEDVDALAAKVRTYAFANVPEASVIPEKMSLGPGQAGLVEYRIFGPSINTLVESAEAIKTAMRATPGARDIQDDWRNPTVTVQVRINQDAARRSGITSADVADALNSQLAGAKISDYRLGDLSIPVIARAKGEARRNLDRLRSLTIPTPSGTPVPLLQIAELSGAPNYARIKRQDIERVITVSAVSSEKSAAAFNDALSDTLQELMRTMPPGYRIELGGEVEGSSDANERLASNFPIALALMVLTLIWQFNSFIRPALILAVIPLTVTGFGLTLALSPGANFGFMAILGVLALAGIVVNNAIILIDRIDVERARRDTIAEAIIEAGVRRLRPIVMTTCTTALGLAPIIIARDVLFYDLALVIAGGLLIGTMLTLIVIPCLYGIVFGVGANKCTDQQAVA